MYRLLGLISFSLAEQQRASVEAQRTWAADLGELGHSDTSVTTIACQTGVEHGGRGHLC